MMQFHDIPNDDVSTSSSTTTVQVTPKNKDKKCVRFHTQIAQMSELPSPLQQQLNEQDDDIVHCPHHHPYNSLYESVWYNRYQLECFRYEAIGMSRQMRAYQQQQQQQYHQNQMQYQQQRVEEASSSSLPCNDVGASTAVQPLLQQGSNPTMAMDAMTRGLEQRCCLERQRRKYLAVHFILRAASKLRPVTDDNNASKLAQVAERCNAWATRLAIEEAKRDFHRAYPNIATDNIGETTTGTAVPAVSVVTNTVPCVENFIPALVSPNHTNYHYANNNNNNNIVIARDSYGSCSNHPSTLKRQRCDDADEVAFHSRTVRQRSG